MNEANTRNITLEKNSIRVDEKGRVVIEDDAVLDQIQGGFGIPETLSSMLANGACANAGCS